MSTVRARRALSISLALLLVVLVAPAAFAESASQDQTVTVETEAPPGVLVLYVQEDVHLEAEGGGPVVAGETSAESNFDLGYKNTLDGNNAWSATVSAQPFVLDDESQSFSQDYLVIEAGHTGDPDFGDVNFGGEQRFPDSDAPLTLMTADGSAKGEFHTGYDEDHEGGGPAWLRLDVPELSSEAMPIGDAHWSTTLTYTLTG